MPHAVIADALHLHVETLRKHYALELSTGAIRRRLEVLLALHAAAKRGRVAAARQYLAGVPERMPVADGRTAPAEDVERPAVPRQAKR